MIVLKSNDQKGSINSSQKQLEHAIIRGLTVLVEDVGAGGDPRVGAGLALEFPDGESHREAGIGAGSRLGLGMGRTAQGYA